MTIMQKSSLENQFFSKWFSAQLGNSDVFSCIRSTVAWIKIFLLFHLNKPNSKRRSYSGERERRRQAH